MTNYSVLKCAKYHSKILVFKIFDYFGFSVSRTKTIIDSDDPFKIISQIIDSGSVKVVIDAGASIGDTSEKLSRAFPNSIIYAFEPYPPFLTELEKKAKRNMNIKVKPFALAMKPGRGILQINQSEGTNSILRSSKSASSIYGTLLETKNSVKIIKKSLSLWVNEEKIQMIDVLKLDIQGGELDALIGAKDLFESKKIKSVICEIMFSKCYESQPNWTEIVSFLEGFGMKLFNIYQPYFQYGRIIQADLIFIADEISSTKSFSDKFHAYSKFLK